ncbi:hypothetical protein OS493_040672 [Desmophyllum pertusum]|uniref:Uncharacterized protein n=1 Tax=Desmophyllum pertusum TaxID=174260 RepID=A0A9X0CU01_9CNID|nr:hypothetical protein OS493_040672 [Desmophyllum pertusum]
MVDARNAGRGKLTGKLKGVKYHTDVEVTDLKDGRYRCHYLVPQAGAYVLSLMWNGQHIPESPYKVTIRDAQVMKASSCFVEGNMLKEGAGATVGQSMGSASIARTRARDNCMYAARGPQRIASAQCSTTRTLRIKSWIGNGLLRNCFKGEFLVETKRAGPARSRSEFMGLEGPSRWKCTVDTSKESFYWSTNTTQPEEGALYNPIKWADQHIPGSSFDVRIVEL